MYDMRALDIVYPCALVILSGCHPITIKTDANRNANFAALRTYAWQPGAKLDTGDPRFDTPRIDREIRAVVDAALGAKGMHKTDSASVDFLIGYRANMALGSSTVTRQRSLEDTDASWGFVGSNTVDYETGTLVLEMTDPNTRQRLWRASASAVVIERASSAERRERIRKAVQKMIDKFPPR
jgi:uncharacterized protein DUF4136